VASTNHGVGGSIFGAKSESTLKSKHANRYTKRCKGKEKKEMDA
jgi:hypothetical protein